MSDKRSTLDEAVAELKDGMTLGIGGWGSRRKPMALVAALARSPLRDLTVVSYGGPDVGVLCAMGKIRKLVFGFVSLDSIPLEPHFRKAREAGALEVMELDEGMLQLGLRAAAWRLPFLPTRAGLGSDILRVNPQLRLVRSPYDDGEELVAMPALHLDVAFVHVNRADARGNTALLGPDPFFDEWFCLAARRRVVSCERIVSTAELAAHGPHSQIIHRGMVDRVVEAPGGAGFTDCSPDYPRDEAAQRAYAATAKDPGAWQAWRAAHIDRTVEASP
jgi:glutaconate CoA-transferase subunit A